MKKSWVTRIAIGLCFWLIGSAYQYFIKDGQSFPAVYLIEAAIDTLIVYMLPMFGNSLLIRDLQKVNCLSVIAHAYGWVIYMSYLPPITYDYLLSIIVIMQWARLIWIRYDDTHGINNNFRCDGVLNAYFNLRRSHKQVQN